jgi:hypothetical protein
MTRMKYKIAYRNDNKRNAGVTTIEAADPDQAVEILKKEFGEDLSDYSFLDKLLVGGSGETFTIHCSKCNKIIKVSNIFSRDELDYAKGKLRYLPPQFCDEHKPT